MGTHTPFIFKWKRPTETLMNNLPMATMPYERITCSLFRLWTLRRYHCITLVKLAFGPFAGCFSKINGLGTANVERTKRLTCCPGGLRQPSSEPQRSRRRAAPDPVSCGTVTGGHRAQMVGGCSVKVTQEAANRYQVGVETQLFGSAF